MMLNDLEVLSFPMYTIPTYSITIYIASLLRFLKKATKSFFERTKNIYKYIDDEKARFHFNFFWYFGVHSG